MCMRLKVADAFGYYVFFSSSSLSNVIATLIKTLRPRNDASDQRSKNGLRVDMFFFCIFYRYVFLTVCLCFYLISRVNLLTVLWRLSSVYLYSLLYYTYISSV